MAGKGTTIRKDLALPIDGRSTVLRLRTPLGAPCLSRPGVLLQGPGISRGNPEGRWYVLTAPGDQRGGRPDTVPAAGRPPRDTSQRIVAPVWALRSIDPAPEEGMPPPGRRATLRTGRELWCCMA
ncbi:MAG: hypothetical protein MZV70_69730 [Desulfobacterales bacterium]|nr:hypothetical protein [Desulfobacterales bacterium]